MVVCKEPPLESYFENQVWQVRVVTPGSIADEAKLRAGDVVFAINGHDVVHARAADVARELRAARGDVRLHVQRGGSAPSL